LAQAPFDVDRAHRWFAVECNNIAWDLVETSERSEAESERMINVAHASCFHWLQVGSALQQQRAQCLLTTVYVRLGYAEAALRHAKKCLELSRDTGGDQTAFDRAATYGAAAKAYALAQQSERADELWHTALDAATSVENADEQKLFQHLYGRD
jgi:hypothetical protein